MTVAGMGLCIDHRMQPYIRPSYPGGSEVAGYDFSSLIEWVYGAVVRRSFPGYIKSLEAREFGP